MVEEIEKLKKDLEAKEGSLKSLRISRDSIRSSTKAEIMSIQARYAREQKELIERQETEITRHRQSLAAREADLEQEQERLMQLEMDVSMRSTQLEDQADELKTSLDAITGKYNAAREAIKRMEAQSKARSAEHKSEVAKLTRVSKKDEKRIAELESAFEKVKAQAKENAKAAREPERARGKSRPRSTATAAEAVSAATEDVANMGVEELREEVATLRVDAVHKDETIRKLGVMVEELERKQNPEGRRPRARVAAMQTEIDELKAELDVRSKKLEALEKVLHFSEGAQTNVSSSNTNSNNESSAPTDQAAAIAQLELKVIALEMEIKERDGKIESLNRGLKEAQEVASERPMRLRNSSAGLSPSAHTPKPTVADMDMSTYAQQPAQGRSSASGLYGSPVNAAVWQHYVIQLNSGSAEAIPGKIISIGIDDGIPSIDAAEFAKAIVPFITSLATKPGADIAIQPSGHEYTSSSGGANDAGLAPLSDVAVRGLYESEIHIATSIWIVSIKNSQGPFFDGLMQLLAQKTVAPATRSVAAACSLARIFSALCLLAADIQRVRIMLCDLLMDAVDSPHTLPVLSNVLAVCPDALRMPQEDEPSHSNSKDISAFRLVVRVFQAIASGIHDLYSEEHSKAEADALYSIMVERCGWRHPSDAEYADKVFVEAGNTLAGLDQTSSNYSVVMCAYSLLAPYVLT
ncbi:hypothetical protein LPJ59_001811 [Coemansia sp. RSA 2399]|nr:hypothetical protein LPJ59_001811 [Coemansia sp. RSA 2399]